MKVTQDQINDLMITGKFDYTKLGQKTTVVTLTLANGFEITATSSCVDLANYDPAVGNEIAIKRIEDKLWELEGYRLQCEGGSSQGCT